MVRRTFDFGAGESAVDFGTLRALGFLFSFAAAAVAFRAHAQDVRDADTLPKNVGGFIISPAIGYGPGVERFGNGWQGGRESLIKDVDQINLSEIFGLGSLDQFGLTHFEGSQSSLGINFAAAYGITDRWTIAAFLPFQHVSYTLDAWLSGASYNGGIINEDRFTCPNGEFSIDNLPDYLESRDGYTFNIGDVSKALTSDCLAYKAPLDTFERMSDGNIHGIGKRSYTGFRDLILGTKYKIYHGEQIQFSAIGYVIVPTGKVNDPDDLFDLNFGDGQTDTALLAAVTVPLGDFRFAASGGYEISWGDTERLRLPTVTFPDDVENALAAGEISEKEVFDKYLDRATSVPIVTRYDVAETKRKLGDTIYVYTGFSYQVLEWLSFGVTLDLMHHFRDSMSEIGARPENAPRYKTEAEIRAEVDELVRSGTLPEEERIPTTRAMLAGSEGRRKASYGWHTVRGTLTAGIGVNVNTLGPFLRDEFPLPILAGISASRFIAGQNIDTPDAVQLNLIIPIPFGEVKDPAEYGFDSQPGKGLPWP